MDSHNSNHLSPAARRVVDWRAGPLLVFTSPGAGKTATMLAWLTALLKDSAKQSFRVLLLTDTNASAESLKARLREKSPAFERRAFIGTLQDFCTGILRQYGSQIGISPEFRVFTHEDQLATVRHAARRTRFAGVSRYQLPVARMLSVIKRLHADSIHPKQSADTVGEEFAAVYAQYLQLLDMEQALDAESLVVQTLRLITNYPGLARHYQQIYPVVCVDEFQEFASAQYKLIKCLVAEVDPTVVAFADQDQVGAAPERINQFEHDFRPDVVYLVENYRNAPEVVDVANRLISHNSSRSHPSPPMVPVRPAEKESPVRLLCFENGEQEASGIAKDIVKRFGKAPADIAVLVRQVRLGRAIEDALIRRGIRVAGRHSPFLSLPFVWLHHLLQLMARRGDRWALEQVCGTLAMLAGANLAVDRIVLRADSSHGDYFRSLITELNDTGSGPFTDPMIQAMKRYVRQNDVLPLVEATLDWFADLATFLPEDVLEGYDSELQAWKALHAETQKKSAPDDTVTADDFLSALDSIGSSQDHMVRVMTVHQAKGVEFECVYVAGLAEGFFPALPTPRRLGHLSLTPEEQIEMERRLLFVALTRARTSLTLTYARAYGTNPRRPSRFLTEMGLLP